MGLLCQGRAKPSLPFAAEYRVIDFSLSNCIHSGIGSIMVLVDYQRRYLAHYLDGDSWIPAHFGSFDILGPKAGSYKGTADAVYQNLANVEKQGADVVLILAADHIYKMDYRKMLAFHEQAGADVTVGVISVPIEEANRFGIVTVDAEGRIIDFVEKPRIPKTNLASMGIYAFNKKILAERLVEDAADPASPHDFGHAIIPRMIRRDRVFAYRFDGPWWDIGTIEAYYEANMELTQEEPVFSLNGGWPILTRDNNVLPPKVSREGNVKHSLISPGCVIEGEVENSILSPGVRVGENAVVRNSVVMANTVIGKHSVVDRCILDEGVTIGKFCYIGFGESLISGNWDITVLGRRVVVPPFTSIGRNCKVLPNVGLADFAARAIPSGTIVSQGLVNHADRRCIMT